MIPAVYGVFVGLAHRTKPLPYDKHIDVGNFVLELVPINQNSITPLHLFIVFLVQQNQVLHPTMSILSAIAESTLKNRDAKNEVSVNC